MMPASVMIETSTRCNVQCYMCPFVGVLPGKLMDWGLFLRAADLLGAGCDAILCGRGEPTLHPRLSEMVAESARRGARPVFHTNGTLLSTGMVSDLAKAGLNQIQVSIVHPVTRAHEELQVGVDSEEVWRGVRRCADAGIHTGIVCVLTTLNLWWTVELVRKAAAHGCFLVTFIRMTVDPHHPAARYEAFASETVRDTRQAILRAEDEAHRLGLQIDRCDCASVL